MNFKFKLGNSQICIKNFHFEFFLQTTVSYNLQCDGPQGLIQSNFNDAEMGNCTCKTAINKLYFG